MSNTNKYRLLSIGMLLITVLLSSCVKEDLSDCPRPFQVTIKALDADLKDITESGVVQQVILFVFDENRQIVSSFELASDFIKNRKSIDIKLDFPGHKSLTLVAWGNINEKVDFSQVNTVKQMSDLYVKLKSGNSVKLEGRNSEKLKSRNSVATEPDDLFYGSINIPVEFGGIEYGKSHVVEIGRKTASVIIQGRNFPANEAVSSYSFVLRESLDTYDSEGVLSGSMVNYQPEIFVNDAGHLATSIFYVFPTVNEKSFVLDIYKNEQLIYSFSKGSDGKDFVPVLGRLLNIIIDFKSEISIKVVITPWGVVYQDVEY